MSETRSWQDFREMAERLLIERTGSNAAEWKKRIAAEGATEERKLRDWLASQGVTGYAQTMLVWETFGYPDYMVASADELIQGQYADRPQLRPVLDAILHAVHEMGPLTIQARKTFVSLVSPRRTFARVQAPTRQRVELALRLEGVEPGGRLQPSRVHEHMPLQISLSSPDDVDDEVLGWLRRAYEENR